MDSLFENYERMGLIYVSRNKGQMIIKGNDFQSNVGTFGGAITINSPDWKNGNQPHVVITSNQFSRNMAYFSGNSIYMRATIAKSGLSSDQVCAGVNLIGNTF